METIIGSSTKEVDTGVLEIPTYNSLKARGSQWCRCVQFRKADKDQGSTLPKWRWVMLAILSLDICVSYIPYYTFVPIPSQSMQVYGVDEAALNVLCILYALVYVPAAFVTGPIVSYMGCCGAFVLAMFLTSFGCAIRCGGASYSALFMQPLTPASSSVVMPEFTSPSADSASPTLTAAGAVTVGPEAFWWLVVGQALCSLGQPLLINSTSELGVEWFPPHERPKAAMVSNLMNFVGSSLSFILPPLVVQENPSSLQQAQQEIASLLRIQLWISGIFLVITTFLYVKTPPRNIPKSLERETSTCASDIYMIFRSKDFWLVNGYFSVFIALCHAFDAVEGSLLEHYGYNASLTAWTAISCSIGSIISTYYESKWITGATGYQGALITAAGFLSLSLMLCFATLYFHWHSSVFVLGVGIMGFCTPGWGCSCELGAEVSYPAREATASSVLEAFSNLSGVFSIIIVQALLDSGYGASVLALLAGTSTLGGALMLCLSGRLPRSEAEAEEASAEQAVISKLRRSFSGSGMASDEEEELGLSHAMSALSTATEKNKQEAAASVQRLSSWVGGSRRSVHLGTLIFLAMFLLLCRLLLFLPQSQLPEELNFLGDSGAASSAPFTIQLTEPEHPQKGGKAGGSKVKSHGTRPITEVQTLVISCSKKRMARLKTQMTKQNVTFTLSPCVTGSDANVAKAVQEGMIGPGASAMLSGLSNKGTAFNKIFGQALSTLKALQTVAEGSAEVVNIVEDREGVWSDYVKRRSELLLLLRDRWDIVKLNARHATGRTVRIHAKGSWMHGNIFRMHPGLSPAVNVGLTNFLVTKKAAQRILEWGRTFDSSGKWQSLDQHLLSRFYKESKVRANFAGFTVTNNALSVRCDSQATLSVKKFVPICVDNGW